MVDKKDENMKKDRIFVNNDAQIEDVEIEDLETQEDNKVKKLINKLKICESEKSKHLDALQRAKADFLNSKKRNKEQLQRETVRASSSFVKKLLPLCDSFDMAMSDEESWNASNENWQSGIEAIHNQLNSILKSYDVEKVGEEGEKFDPNIHEALSVDEKSDADTDIVTKVLQSGYKRNKELIRPAKVILSK